MKVEYTEFGGFEFIAEDGKDIVWLKELIANTDEGGKFLVDMTDGHILEDDTPATNINFETAKDKDGNVWGSINKIIYNPFGR